MHDNDAKTADGVRKQWHLIRPGDRVTMRTPHGQEVTGRVTMKFDTHCVLNLGGKHGTPGVVNPLNFVKHKPAPAGKRTWL
jgi:hypothetical protein